MKKNFMVGCSLASVVYFDIWRLLFAATTPHGFFLKRSPSDYAAAIITVLAVGIVAAAVTPLQTRLPRTVRYVGNLLFISSGLLVVNELRKANSNILPALLGLWAEVPAAIRAPFLVGSGIFLLALTLRCANRLGTVYRKILLATFAFAVFVVLKSTWILATTDFSVFGDLQRPTHTGVRSATRVVLIVFDEMDYETAFARRKENLRLPNFDALQAASLTFDSAYSPGQNTIQSMPSYLLGLRVDSVTPVAANAFTAVLSDGRELLVDSASSIFSIPAAQGERTALLGFSLPYCRLRLVAMVDYCKTMTSLDSDGATEGRNLLLQAAIRQMQSLVPFSRRRMHIAGLRELLSSAATVAADSAYSLVLVHLPLPHSPWIWDRFSSQFKLTISGRDGYLGNLVLADRILGQIRKRMTEENVWDTTTLIVTADHPWRAKLAEGMSTDSRIPLIIKQSGATTGEHESKRINTIIVSEVLTTLMRAKVKNPAALRTLLTNAGSP